MNSNMKIASPIEIDKRKATDIRSGDTIKVFQKITEGDKTRIQVFEGLVIATKHGKEAGATFTVRKVASGVGVEKIFPLYSPMIEKIEKVRSSKVRKNKLYYIREKVSREIRRQMRNERMVNVKTSPEVVSEETSEEVK